ncbi:hypothetical protein MASR1M49_32920 [Pararhodobacter aggregans]
MPPKRGTSSWKQQYREVLVGLHTGTNSPKRIYVRNDGGMSGEFSTHHPAPGRSVEHEALVVFSLAKVRRFPVGMEEKISEYEQQLRREAAADDT